jgi:hypothetical protein
MLNALLEPEIDVDEIQGLHRQLADQRAVQLHVVRGCLKRVGNGVRGPLDRSDLG